MLSQGSFDIVSYVLYNEESASIPKEDVYEYSLATSNDLEWINNQYDSIGFVRSDLKRDKVAIITYNNEYAGVGRLVQIDEDTLEMGGIFILPQFRGLQLAGELVLFLVETAKNHKYKMYIVFLLRN